MSTPTSPPSPSSTSASLPGQPISRVGLIQIVGFLVCVEIASGAIQGYYTPIFSDIARHLQIHDADLNWFEAAQLMVAALIVPVLSRLGDLVGHRTVLLWSTVLTAAATWGVAFAPTFWTFLVAWALAGFYVVWLPLEVAIIHRRTHGDAARTRLAAGILVFALEFAVIVSALTAGVLATSLSMTVLLCLPAIVVTAVIPAIWFGVPHQPVTAEGRMDWAGFALVTAALVLIMAGLMVMRLDGPLGIRTLVLLGAGLVALFLFARYELAHRDPLVDLRVMGARAQWPIQVTAFLFGVSVLGAQVPLSTFARTDPAITGYGLGVSAAAVSILIGVYVLCLALGALLLPLVARAVGPVRALAVGSVLVAIGYLLFLPFHASMAQLLTNMGIAGIGSGMLVAGLPAIAAENAPPTHTGLVTGMTNTTKTIGGAIASSVFALALAQGGSIGGVEDVHPPLAGYMVVWAICGVTALIAPLLLLLRTRRS